MLDLQSSQSLMPIDIKQVGVKNIKYPAKVVIEPNHLQAVCASFNLFIHLDKTQRGTHMSRFVNVLEAKDWILSTSSMYELTQEIKAKLESSQAFVSAQFPIFITKYAPVSNIPGKVDYLCTLKTHVKAKQTIHIIAVEVPITTLCPCSKGISTYGAHNQRATVSLQVTVAQDYSLKKLIELVEKQASCEIFSALKRPDEKYVTEKAYENPKFVEDYVRHIAADLYTIPEIYGFNVSINNEESIHNHAAFAEVSHEWPFE